MRRFLHIGWPLADLVLGRGARLVLSLAAASLGPTAARGAESRTIQLALADTPPGAAPDGCRPALTGDGGPSIWRVLSEPRGAISETSREAIDGRYALCIVDSVQAQDVELSVDFTPREGKMVQGAGLIARVKSPQDYYVLRANALEGNVRLYQVTRGVRWLFASADASVPTGQRQRLGLTVKGDVLTATLDGRILFEAHDATIGGSGAIGLWTKSDSLIEFSNLSVKVLDP